MRSLTSSSVCGRRVEHDLQDGPDFLDHDVGDRNRVRLGASNIAATERGAMRTLRRLWPLTAVVAAMVAVPSGARADCAEPTASFLLELAGEGEGSVFVGMVVHGGDVAHLAVDQVWSGPDLAPEVAVRTGPDQLPWPASRVLQTASSVDADLLLGERYLVATHADFGFS